jgi:hypothetical protein
MKERIYPHFLDLGSSWRWVVSFTPRTLYPRYTLARRLGEPQGRSYVEESIILSLAGLELPQLDHPQSGAISRLPTFMVFYCNMLRSLSFIFLPADNSYSFSYMTIYDGVNMHIYHCMCQVSQTSMFTNISISNSMWHLLTFYVNHSQELSKTE